MFSKTNSDISKIENKENRFEKETIITLSNQLFYDY